MGTAANILTPNRPTRRPGPWRAPRRTVKDQENTDPGQPDHPDHGVRHRRAAPHAGDGPGPGRREAEVNFSYTGPARCRPANLYRPDPSQPATGLNLARSGARTQGQSTPRRPTCSTPSRSASAGCSAPRRASTISTPITMRSRCRRGRESGAAGRHPIPAHIELSDHLSSTASCRCCTSRPRTAACTPCGPTRSSRRARTWR
jgi:hypothetical protein